MRKIASVALAIAATTCAASEIPQPSPSQVYSDGVTSVHFIAYACQAKRGDTTGFFSGVCGGFVGLKLDQYRQSSKLIGQASAAKARRALVGPDGTNYTKLFCPRTMSPETLASMLVDDVQAHPEKLNASADKEIDELISKIPCNEVN